MEWYAEFFKNKGKIWGLNISENKTNSFGNFFKK